LCEASDAMEPVIFHDHRTLRRPILVLAFSGWSDAGQSATTAVRFLAEQLGATKLASIDPEEFFDFTVVRPQVRLVEGMHRSIEWTTLEFHAATVPATPHDYVFGWGPEPHLKWKTFCTALLALAERAGVEQVVTLGGYLAEVLYSRPVPVTGFATDPERLRPLGVSGTRYQGPTGIVGVLGDACRRAGMEHVSLWAALPHYVAALPNPRGSLALLLRLTELLQLPVDLAPLKEAAATFEQQVNDAVAKDPQLSAYVRELKKREFAN
jgi:predicted ATP-grasp superfamily ATP-dependent carboligase